MRVAFIVSMLLLLPCTLTAQRVVGRVIDATSGAAIANADIRVESAERDGATATTSDSLGRFSLRINPGAPRYRVTVRHVAYTPTVAELSVGAQDQVEVVIRMSVTALQLPPIDVIASSRVRDHFLERVGYYQRKGAGFGVFIDPEEIERRGPLYTTDLFRNVSGVRVVPMGGLRGNDIRITRGEDPNCPPRVYIDRVIVRQGGRMVTGDASIDALVQPAHVHSIEIYRSPAEIPTEFAGANVRCGVVLIWTKRGAAGG